MPMDSLTKLQEAAKLARTNHFSEIIVKYSHQPRVLFNTINTILEPSASVCLESSIANCERLKKYIFDKMICICFAIVPTKLDLGVVAAPLGSFRAFKIMSLLEIMGR